MKFLTIFFSGTGNTAWAVSRLGVAALGLGHSHSLMSAREVVALRPEDLASALSEADTLILAYPVYGADFPPAIKRVLSRIAAAEAGPRPAACLCTMGYVDAQGPFAAFRALRASGLGPRGYLPVLLSNNVCVPRIPMKPAPAAVIARRKAAAAGPIGRFAAALGSGKTFVRGIGPYLIPGIFIRKASSKRLERPSLLLSWDGSRCSRCGLCVRECPMGALRLERGRLIIGEDCSYCTRCYNICPTQAILPEGEYAAPELYPRYLSPPDR
jgi:NAD-dependent dihydropyrimidine dehydrogenase PreA subunit